MKHKINPNIDKIFKLLADNIKNPTTELKYSNPYTLLVAVVLSAQATDVSVNKATEALFKMVDTPEKMINFGENNLKSHIQIIGLFNSKARNIIKLSIILKEQFNSQVPNTLEDLVKLPGVGRKTANVILNTVFNKPTIAVDTHVYRLSHRLGLVEENDNTPLQTELSLNKNIPKQYLMNAHHLLILHGRYICKAKKPQCQVCCLQNLCPYYKKRKI